MNNIRAPSTSGESLLSQQNDKVWFYNFDDITLNLEDFMHKEVKLGDKRTFRLLPLIQTFVSSSNANNLSEFKRNKIQEFKDQKIQLEKNKLREGQSYYYETMITRILDNLDFYLRNEVLLYSIKTFKTDFKIQSNINPSSSSPFRAQNQPLNNSNTPLLKPTKPKISLLTNVPSNSNSPNKLNYPSQQQQTQQQQQFSPSPPSSPQMGNANIPTAANPQSPYKSHQFSSQLSTTGMIQRTLTKVSDYKQKELPKEDIFYRQCQDYIATEKLYCNDFWIFQSEKQRYERYFCTCVRLFHFFFELVEYKDIQAEIRKNNLELSDPDGLNGAEGSNNNNNYYDEENGRLDEEQEEYLQAQNDLHDMIKYCYEEVKYCIQLITKGYEKVDSMSFWIDILMLFLKNTLTKGYQETRQLLTTEFSAIADRIRDKFKQIRDSSKIRANDIRNNLFQEIETVAIEKNYSQGIGYFPVIVLLSEKNSQGQQNEQQERRISDAEIEAQDSNLSSLESLPKISITPNQ